MLLITAVLELTPYQFLSFSLESDYSDTLIQFFSAPSNVSATLEVLNFTFPPAWLMGRFEHFAVVLSQPASAI